MQGCSVFAGYTDIRLLTLNLEELSFCRRALFALSDGPYTWCPGCQVQAWEIMAIYWGFHWEDLVDSLMWCSIYPCSNSNPKKCPLSRNNLSLISLLQKLGQGEKCNIITKANCLSMPYNIHTKIHSCISHIQLLKINSNNNNNNNNNVPVSWSHWTENWVVSVAVNCVLCSSSFKQSQVKHGRKNKNKKQKETML